MKKIIACVTLFAGLVILSCAGRAQDNEDKPKTVNPKTIKELEEDIRQHGEDLLHLQKKVKMQEERANKLEQELAKKDKTWAKEREEVAKQQKEWEKKHTDTIDDLKKDYDRKLEDQQKAYDNKVDKLERIVNRLPKGTEIHQYFLHNTSRHPGWQLGNKGNDWRKPRDNYFILDAPDGAIANWHVIASPVGGDVGSPQGHHLYGFHVEVIDENQGQWRVIDFSLAESANQQVREVHRPGVTVTLVRKS